MVANGAKNTKQNSPLDKFVGAGENSANKGGERWEADWSQVNSPLLVGAIAAAAHFQGALLFGLSRDGYMFNVTVFSPQRKK